MDRFLKALWRRLARVCGLLVLSDYLMLLRYTTLGLVLSFGAASAQIELVSPNPDEGGRFGRSVAGVPDLDGDGLGDIVVGAWLEDRDEIHKNLGRVYVYSGSTSRLLHTLSSPNESVLINGLFGFSVAGTPDVNGNGIDDIVVGAYEEGSDNSLFPGRAYVFEGSTGALVCSLQSPNETYGGQFGWSVSGVPDVDGDGGGDVVVGANHEGSIEYPEGGRAYVFNGLTGNLIYTLSSPNEELEGQFGMSVSGIEDLNGDRRGEIVVAAPWETNAPKRWRAGTVYIFDGWTGSLLRTLHSPTAEVGGGFGWSVSAVPDVNEDGIADLIIGASREDPGESPTESGRAHLFDGASCAFLRTFVSPNEEANAHFGYPVSGVPDVNGDGSGDVVVGAQWEDPGATPNNAGLAYIFDGSSGALLQTLVSPNEEEDGRFGISVGGIPDLNSDGLGDILIGAQNENPHESPFDSGRAYLFQSPFRLPEIDVQPLVVDFGNQQFEGGPTTPIRVLIQNNGFGDLHFTKDEVLLMGPNVADFQFASTPDTSSIPPGGTRPIDIVFTPTSLGEKIADLVITTMAPNQPEIVIPISGVGSDSSFHVLRSSNEGFQGSFGSSVAGLSDVNGDGRGDLAIGAIREGTTGIVHIIDGSTTQVLRAVLPSNSDSFAGFGYSVAGIRDITGDLLGDLIVGAPYLNRDATVADSGAVYVFDGNKAEILHFLTSPNETMYGEFGHAISSVPDTNGDGWDEVLVGSYREPSENGFERGGRAYLFDGSTGDLLHSYSSPNEREGGGFGIAVAGIADLNGDGLGEVAVGAPKDPNDAGRATGRVYLFDGSTGLLVRTLDLPLSRLRRDNSLTALSSAPDSNADGFYEIVVGGRDTGGEGAAYVFSGANGELLHSLSSPNAEGQGAFANSVSGVEDLNGDGRGDFVIGAFEEDPLGSPDESGRAYIFDGSTGLVLKTLASPNEELRGRFGVGVSGVEDTNGDGLGEILVGAASEDPGRSLDRAGRAYFFVSPFFSSEIVVEPNALDFGERQVDEGPSEEQSLSVTNLGTAAIEFLEAGYEFTGFDPQDFLIVNDSEPTSIDPGETREFQIAFDPTLPTEKLASLRLITNDPKRPVLEVPLSGVGTDSNLRSLRAPLTDSNGEFGYAVSSLPDITGDGLSDVAVSARNDRAVFLFDGDSTSHLRSLSSPNPAGSGGFGASVAGFPDVDGDGFGEVLVGADSEVVDSEIGGSGRAYLLSGASGAVLQTFASPNLERSGAFGESVSGVPDVNGDGVWDIVVGAPLERGNGLSRGGRAYIFDGSSGTLIRGLKSPLLLGHARFGTSVLGIPDLNGNGSGDVAIGAYLEESEDGPEDAGRVHIFDSLTGAVIGTLVSPHEQEDGWFGFSLSRFEDMDGDGTEEILVGAYLENANGITGSGRAYLFNPASGQVLRTLTSPTSSKNGHFARSLSRTHDINGDGIGEIAVGAPQESFPGTSSESGKTYLFDGAEGRLLQIFLSPNEKKEGLFGFSLAGNPDPSPNRKWDVIVGAYRENPRSQGLGRAYLFKANFAQIYPIPGSLEFQEPLPNSGVPVDQTLLIENRGNEPLLFEDPGIAIVGTTPLAFSFADIPDTSPVVPGGQIEIAIRFDTAFTGESGASLRLTSNHSGVLSTFDVPLRGVVADPSVSIVRSANEQEHGSFGTSVSGIPDINGDGRGDFIVGSSRERPTDSFSRVGSAHIFDGSTGEIHRTLISPGPAIDGGFGRSISGVPDLNNNGGGDVIVGALEEPGTNPRRHSGAGRAYVFDASTGVLIHSLLSPNEESGGSFGNAVSCTPDLNGDGVWDLIVGAYREDVSSSPSNAGAAYVYDGKTGSLIHSLGSPSERESGYFGWAVAGLSDLNGDGLGEILVGAYRENQAGEGAPGRAHVFDGNSGGLLYTLKSPDLLNGVSFGRAVAGVPDVNGDGVNDILVGGALRDLPGEPSFTGRVYLFDGPTGQFLRALSDPDVWDQGTFGDSLAGISDVNGNGSGDVVVGADQEDFGLEFLDCGKAYVFDGETGDLISTLASPNRALNGLFGTSVSGTPDLNGDGLQEILVGASLESAGESPIRSGRAFIFESPFPSGFFPNPTPTSTPVPTPTSTPTPTNAPCDSGYYILDSLGGRHRVGNPPIVTGPVYFGFDIARDLERMICRSSGIPEPGLVVLDGFGAVHVVGEAGCELSQDFYFGDVSLEEFPKGRAVDLIMSSDSAGFWVLTDYGGIYRAGSALEPGQSALVEDSDLDGVLGSDIPMGAQRASTFPAEGASLRAVSLIVFDTEGDSRAEAYLILDSQGGRYPLSPQGEAFLPGASAGFPDNHPFKLWDPGAYAWPFFAGLDIARDMELHESLQGTVILDGWGGVHPVPVNIEDNPVYFAANRVSNSDPSPLNVVGLPYLAMGFDDPLTEILEDNPSIVGPDVASIFTDLEFTTCGGGLYTGDRFGGVFALGKGRLDTMNVSAPFENSPYFFPFLFMEDMEIFGINETIKP